MTSAGPLEPILSEIERALAQGLYYLAIMLSLAPPDICAALQNEDGRSTTDGYKRWFELHLAAKFFMFTADDCFSLRCGVLHQGKMGIMKRGAEFERVLFTAPDTPGYVHNNKFPGAVNFDTPTFCRDIMESVRDWFHNAMNDPIVKKNLPSLVQYRPNGLAPYIVGMPLIA
jgi:hypothetical protein